MKVTKQTQLEVDKHAKRLEILGMFASPFHGSSSLGPHPKTLDSTVVGLSLVGHRTDPM
jgi:hypothetical protein